MTRNTKSVTLTVSTMGGNGAQFADGASTPGAGTSVLTQLTSFQMIHAMGTPAGASDPVELYIPFHAIDMAVVEVSTSSETVDDAVCEE